MDSETKKQLLFWVKTWEQAGKALEKIHEEELRQFDYNKSFPVIDGMLRWALANAQPRTTSGLVQQQALFQQLVNGQ